MVNIFFLMWVRSRYTMVRCAAPPGRAGSTDAAVAAAVADDADDDDDEVDAGCGRQPQFSLFEIVLMWLAFRRQGAVTPVRMCAIASWIDRSSSGPGTGVVTSNL